VNVSGTTAIVAGEESVESGDTMGISELQASECCALEHCGIMKISHTRVALDTDVHARGVRAPDINIGIGDDLAGLVVDNLDGESHTETLLALCDVLADVLSLDVCFIG
jgi:hypothetical protein